MVALAALMLRVNVSAFAWALPRTTPSDCAGVAENPNATAATNASSATACHFPTRPDDAHRPDRPSPRSVLLNTVV